MGKNKNKQKRNPPKNGFQSAHAPAADTNRNNREEPNMSFATESGPENVVTIKVVGVGGAGNNVVNRMVKSGDRKSTRLNSSHASKSRMPSSA